MRGLLLLLLLVVKMLLVHDLQLPVLFLQVAGQVSDLLLEVGCIKGSSVVFALEVVAEGLQFEVFIAGLLVLSGCLHMGLCSYKRIAFPVLFDLKQIEIERLFVYPEALDGVVPARRPNRLHPFVQED